MSQILSKEIMWQMLDNWPEVIVNSFENTLSGAYGGVRYLIVGELVGVLDGEIELGCAQTIQYLNNFGWKHICVEEVIRSSLGDFFCVYSHEGGPAVILTSPGFSGLCYCLNDSKLFVARTEAELVNRLAGERKYENLEVIRYIVDNINISPLKTFWKDIWRLPGGCKLRTDSVCNGPKSILLPSFCNHDVKDPIFNETVDAVCRLLAAHYSHKKIVVPISGGVDGVLWVCALAKAGANILAVCGEKRGDSEEEICKSIVGRLVELGYDNITFYSAGISGVDRLKGLELTRRKLKWLIKSNYIQDEYKLKLADLKILEVVDLDSAIFLNGYGIDELYMGSKDEPRYSSVYKQTILKRIGTLINHRHFLDVSLMIDYFFFKLRVSLMKTAIRDALRPALFKRAICGKVGVNKYRWYVGTKAAYDSQVDSQVKGIMDLLRRSMLSVQSYKDYRYFIRSFIYYHVEFTHLVRFANHGRSLGVPYLLPYEFGPIRKFCCNNLSLSIRDGIRPKALLYDYVNDVLGEGFYEELQLPDRHNRWVGVFRMWFRRLGRTVLKKISIGPCHSSLKYLEEYHEEVADFALRFQENIHPEFAPYIRQLSDDIKTGGLSPRGNISTREYENYVHLLFYMKNAERA